MVKNVVESLRPEKLMIHMRALCRKIGARPPTSKQERQAAEYVYRTLAAMGYSAMQEQTFKSQKSIGWVTLPLAGALALTVPLAKWGGLLGKGVGGTLSLGAAKPSDFDEHLKVLPLLDKADKVLPPILERLEKEAIATLGQDWVENWKVGYLATIILLATLIYQ